MDYLVEHFNTELDAFYQKGLPSFHPTDTPNLNLHMHNHFELYIFISGHANFFIDNKFYALQEGSLIFINNDQVHGPQNIEHQELARCAVHFSPKLASRLSSPDTNLLQPFYDRRNVIPLDAEQLAMMTFLGKRLIDEMYQPKPGSDLLVPAHFIDLLVHAKRCAENQESDEHINNHLSPLTSELLDFVQENIADPELSLEKIAAHFNHNKIYLNRIFKKEMGVTLYQYILMSRISMAKRILKHNNDIYNCYEACGFSSYNNFIRAFKKLTGVSPKQFSITAT